MAGQRDTLESFPAPGSLCVTGVKAPEKKATPAPHPGREYHGSREHPKPGRRRLARSHCRGLAFFSHGAQKMFGWFGGVGPDGGTVELTSSLPRRRPHRSPRAALPSCSACSPAPSCPYCFGRDGGRVFLDARTGSGETWWWDNRGEMGRAALPWLLFAAAGAGPLSLDAGESRGNPSHPAGNLPLGYRLDRQVAETDPLPALGQARDKGVAGGRDSSPAPRCSP